MIRIVVHDLTGKPIECKIKRRNLESPAGMVSRAVTVTIETDRAPDAQARALMTKLNEIGYGAKFVRAQAEPSVRD